MGILALPPGFTISTKLDIWKPIMVNNLFFLALVAALAMEFVAIQALTCYKKGLKTTECGGDNNACMYELAGGVKSALGCTLMPENGLDENECVITKKAATKKTCYCQKDKCNGQVRQKSSMMVFVSALLVSVLAKF